MNLKKIFLTFTPLVILVGLAIFVRIWFVKEGSLLFSYDQARDAFTAKQIIAGDLKIMGPPSSILQGLSHGVIWYYLLAGFYLIGKGSPVIATFAYSLLLSLAAIPIYFLAKTFTKNKSVAFLSSFLWVISFEAIQYSTWLSNPSLAFLFVPMIYIGLWGWVEKKNKLLFAALTGLGLGLSVQANLFLVYHFIPAAVWLYLNKKEIHIKEIFVSLALFLLSISTMIVEQIKFGFGGIKGAAFVLSGGDIFIKSRGLGDFIVSYLNQLGVVFSNNLFPFNQAMGGILGIGLIAYLIFSIKKEFASKKWLLLIFLYLFSHLTISIFGGASTPYIGVGLGIALLILVSYSLFLLWNKHKMVAIVVGGLIILSNISAIVIKNKDSIFAIQQEMRISNQIELMDYTYKEAEGKPFNLNTVTAPLWMNVTWTYLYKWYGMGKYGYLPNFIGRDQIGQIDQLPQEIIKNEIGFLIIEPSIAIPQRYIDAALSEENARSKVIEEKKWGTLIVQKRQLLKTY